MATPRQLQAALNAQLDGLPLLGPMIRRDCIEHLAAAGFVAEKDVLYIDPAFSTIIADALRSVERSSLLRLSQDPGELLYEDKLAEHAERLLDIIRVEPGEPDEIDGGWRYVSRSPGGLIDERVVDVDALCRDIETLAMSARQSAEGMRELLTAAPKTRSKSTPERYFARLAMLVVWKYWLNGSLGFSNGNCTPEGPMIRFMTAMLVDETPHGIAEFAGRHGDKLDRIARFCVPHNLFVTAGG